MEPDPARSRSAVRQAAACALLVGLAFVQQPGFLTSDTKFDLVVDPARFLGRALHLWDPNAAFGQLQNQAYGYLWPMGPFFLLGHGIGVPGWVVQRLWLALVLCVAFLGATRVTRALGVRSDLACVVAGFAYALSPRMLSTLGPISIEAWPSALAPWVLLPLVLGATRMPARRAAALSAVAVAMVGGVNAAATFAVLPLGVVWLLTRTPGPRRRQLMLWWPPLVLLGTLWWLVPLFVLGGYSPPFLDFIETSAATTFPTTLFDVLRGTSDWVPYVDAGSRAGNELLRTPFLVLASGGVLLVGFVGLLDRRTPNRVFLSLSLALGVVIVTAGHHGEVQGPLSSELRGLLDGALAPLRNIHKFDPIVRVPLVVGLGAALDHALARWPSGATNPAESVQMSLDRFNRRMLMGLTILVVAVAASPAIGGRIPPAAPVLSVPTYWTDTASWLARHQDGGTALLAPGSSFADYVWGSPKDETLQYLDGGAWAVRSAIPLAPTGNIRMLDEIEDRLAQGAASPHLDSYLARAGIRYLVVRNDLRNAQDVPDPVLVHQAVLGSVGLARVAAFGPQIGGSAHVDNSGRRLLVNGGWQSTWPAVEIFEVTGSQGSASSVATTPVVAGGPEDLLDLQDLGVLGNGPTQLAADIAQGHPPAGSEVLLTDGLRDREREFPRIYDGYSPVLAAGDVRRTGSPAADYQVAPRRWRTVARYEGARAVSASSSQSDADADGGAQRGDLPYAALDGSTSTAWVSGPESSTGVWWQVDLDGLEPVPEVTLTGGALAAADQKVRIQTSYGTKTPVSLGPGQVRTVRLSSTRPTSFLRVADARNGPGPALSLAEVAAPGLEVTRELVLPRLPGRWGDPGVIALRADRDARTGCAVVSGDVRCLPARAVTSEEAVRSARIVTLGAGRAYRPELTVLPRAGRALDRLMLTGQLVDVTASSEGVSDPRSSAVAAVDGSSATAWSARTDDEQPTLRLDWLSPRRITGLTLSAPAGSPVSVPTSITLVGDGGSRRVELDAHGHASFPVMRTAHLQVVVDSAESVQDLDTDGGSTVIGVGIGELRLQGSGEGALLQLSTQERRFACGTGPGVVVNGAAYRTSVLASPAQLEAGSPVPARICRISQVQLNRGANQISFASSDAFGFSSLTLLDGSPGLTGAVAVRAAQDGPVRRHAHPDSDARLLELHQNVNQGWSATQHGVRLHAVVLDGWQQGWVLGGAPGEVTMRFAPDRVYRAGLGLGLVTLLVQLALVLRWLRRRQPHSPALAERSMSVVVAALCGVTVGVMVAGVVGGLVALGVAVLARVLGSWGAPVASVMSWTLAAPCLATATAYALRPWASSSGWAGTEAWPQYVMLVPLLAVVVGAGRAAPRSFSRIDGRSTKR